MPYMRIPFFMVCRHMLCQQTRIAHNVQILEYKTFQSSTNSKARPSALRIFVYPFADRLMITTVGKTIDFLEHVVRLTRRCSNFKYS